MVRKPFGRDLAALVLLALATAGFFWRVVSGLNWMPADGGDLVSFLYPTYRFAATSLLEGVWPLWNPYLYSGAPHVGDIQAGFLYLPNLLLFLLKPDFSYASLQVLSMAHIWFAGAGMYLLLARGFRLRRIAALAGALAFMFADPFLTHFGNLNLNAAASWLPWVFWGWLGVLQRMPERHLLPRLLLTAVLLALAISAGHIQATLFTVLALGVFTLLWLGLQRTEPRAGRRALWVLLGFAAMVFLAALLAAPILLPAFELAARTARADWNYTATAGYSLSPAQWIGWLIPGFFGRGPQFHWGAWPRVEMGYLGILPLVLAGLALLLRRVEHERHTWALVGLAGVSSVLALGIYAIPHGWLTLLPGFGQLRAPARFVWVTDFAVAALAGIGLHALLGQLGDARRATLDKAWRWLARTTGGVWLVAVPLAYATLLLVQDRDPAIVVRISITLLAVVTFAGLLLASLFLLWLRRSGRVRTATLGWLAVLLIFLDVASLGAYQDLGDRDPSQTFNRTPVAAFFAAQPGPYRIDSRTGIESIWQPDTAIMLGLEDVTGVANPLVLADFERYWGALGSRSSRLYDLLNVRYVVAAKDVTLDWDKFSLAFDGDPQINVYENKRALPRAFVVPSVVFTATADEAFAAIHADGFDPTQTVVIEGNSTAALGAGGEVREIRSGPNSLSLQTAATAPVTVFVSQVWYGGWQVYVDGVRAGAPLRANFLFQAVTAPAGEHLIELRYEPGTWRVGWLLVGATLLILLIGVVLSWRGRKRHDH